MSPCFSQQKLHSWVRAGAVGDFLCLPFWGFLRLRFSPLLAVLKLLLLVFQLCCFGFVSLLVCGSLWSRCAVQRCEIVSRDAAVLWRHLEDAICALLSLPREQKMCVMGLSPFLTSQNTLVIRADGTFLELQLGVEEFVSSS